MPTGIVLGGGATLGDFQVGALKLLYEKGVLPEIKCVYGTSIGAINAVIVSTGRACDQRLKKYWSDGVIGRDDLIPQHHWSENITPILRAFIHAEKHSKIPGGRIRLIGRVRAISALIRQSKEELPTDIIGGIDDLEDMLGSVVRKSTLYTADKLKRRMLDRIDDIEKALDPEIVFGLSATNLETGEKTCFSNDKKLYGKQDDTLYVPCESKEALVEAALASAAVPGLFPPVEVRGSYYIDGGAREVVPVKGAVRSGADTIYAILCLPRFVRKRKYAFLDVRGEKENKGTAWKTSNLFDVRPEDWVANNRNWDPKSEECDVLDIANRTAAILLDELTEENLCQTDDTRKKITLKVIDPLLPVHGWTQLNIGLLKINADQGYMRAFDVVCAPESNSLYEQCEQSTAEITLRRTKIWTLEHQLIEEWSQAKGNSQCIARSSWDALHAWHVLHQLRADVVDTKILYNIRWHKKQLKECIEQRLAAVASSSLSDEDKKLSLPSDYLKMYLCWEPHNWELEGRDKTPRIPSPWHRLDLGEWGSDVIDEDWSVGHPPGDCESRSLL
jgi:predicted acylesterase/phospholipase RssA